MTLYHIDFEPVGRRGDCSNEQSLLESARQLSVDLVSICGGMGSCTRCKIQVVLGQVSELTIDEKNNLTRRELKQDYRLACQTFPLAKAAIRMGIQALVEANGLTENDIEQVIIAGACGAFIDVSSAITIGMLPPLPIERFTQVGNVAGTGARLALISREQRAVAKRIAERDRYIELASVANFNSRFATATDLF